ncbi:heterokaryon incompatibility protein [Colletotrichum musicola]|uniref:Heterokaryon incompatibility protein n=1 Tax=Colletotrichum musicola TaxID=2175873 RepID=A0A8H6JFG0_9PEZI|nr:heterokaryon incompatibility protein [Colletotrichum musicola]
MSPTVDCSWATDKSPERYRLIDNRLLKTEIDRSPLVGEIPFQDKLRLKQVSASGASARDEWEAIVQAYSDSMLTKDSDRIIALAGIAGLIQEHLQDDYVVGLWRRNQAIELLWSTKGTHVQKPRPNPCIAPTWSWLLTNRPVSVLTARDPGLVQSVLIQITDYKVDLVDSASPTGNIYPDALLKLRGRIKRASWAEGRCFKLTVFLLPFAVFYHGDGASLIMGLILTPVNEEAETYQRLGHFLIDKKMGRHLLQQRPSPSQEKASVPVSVGSANHSDKGKQALRGVGEQAEHPGQAESLDHHTRQGRTDTSLQRATEDQGTAGESV